ncbi:MAG: formimidoylglutamate deiminase [Xanthomonadales bacterium]|nr:formimidoylglutamate deiminase [Xanthomonadales bacterium]
MSNPRIQVEKFWTSEGWRRNVSFVPGDAASSPELLSGHWLPGIPNTHSHAFQRAMAGLAEYQTDAADSFWTWRELMYAFAGRMDPDSLYAVATQLYVEMLEAGYTSVCEFHYVHHQPDGTPYDDPAAMSRALIAAARDAGIGMTLLPVLYQRGGFDGRPLNARQQRFFHDTDAYLRLIDALRTEESPMLRIGVCFHSLRAVSMASIDGVLAALGGERPIHLHIAEQMPEVEDCIAAHGARPVRHLLDRQPVGANWTLVHATHMDASEIRDLAASGASVSICPTTEANLGDGLFSLPEWRAANGRWSIGSDSHISVSPVEELRWLEYGQRFKTGHRNVCVGDADDPFRRHVGNTLLAEAINGASGSTGRDASAGLIRLDTSQPALYGDDEALIDRWLFSGNRSAVSDVMVDGVWLVRDGRHRHRDGVADRYRDTLRQLTG